MAGTIGTRRRNGSLNAFSSRDQVSRSSQQGGAAIHVATDTSFVNSSSTIASAGSSFPTDIVAGQIINVTGSALNDREWRVVSVAADAIVVDPDLVRDESAGATIIITVV